MKKAILVPARSGSTRVKNKNLRHLKGIPLIGHVIKKGLASGEDVDVWVSTNCQEITEVAKGFGAKVIPRPDELASSHSTSISVVIHAMIWMRENNVKIPDLMAFCPPTNPFVKSSTIEKMFKKLADPSVTHNSIATITPPFTHPFRIVSLDDNGEIKAGIIDIDGKRIFDIHCSQDWPVVYEGTPVCRMTKTKFWLDLIDNHIGNPFEIDGRTYDHNNSLGHIVEQVESMDIDTEEDFRRAELYAEYL